MNYSKFLVLILLSFIPIISCSTEKNDVTLEGKWKVVDWTYISYVGRSLDEDEKKEMNESLIGLILDFKLDQTFSSSNPDMFKSLENKPFKVEKYNRILIENQNFLFLIRDNQCFLFFSNIVFEIKKIENYSGSKIRLEKLTDEHLTSDDVSNKEDKTSNTTYQVSDLDESPKLKMAEDCLIDCLYNSFNENIKYYIDFSKVEKDISYFISFIINKSGNITNIKVKHKYNKPIGKRGLYPKVTVEWEQQPEENIHKQSFSEIESSIVKSILYFDGNLIPGKKDNQNVNTELKLEFRLISN